MFFFVYVFYFRFFLFVGKFIRNIDNKTNWTCGQTLSRLKSPYQASWLPIEEWDEIGLNPKCLYCPTSPHNAKLSSSSVEWLLLQFVILFSVNEWSCSSFSLVSVSNCNIEQIYRTKESNGCGDKQFTNQHNGQIMK